ncbi:hypothetical protein [Paractinoplanes hotanensis]|uniref:Uncharacterized protein n=1 Tax=Paractinoplanes hotanensis TaxID=2906497 RepID=A0ABT0Y2M3_9ACTN|nr:hypothetical protein [Actinoplanes hotanensis]MCM4080289.1 hypothetical protein [Actinoplanes hotanensis]
MDLQDVVDRVVARTPGVRWSIAVPGRAAPGDTAVVLHAMREMGTALS